MWIRLWVLRWFADSIGRCCLLALVGGFRCGSCEGLGALSVQRRARMSWQRPGSDGGGPALQAGRLCGARDELALGNSRRERRSLWSNNPSESDGQSVLRTPSSPLCSSTPPTSPSHYQLILLRPAGGVARFRLALSHACGLCRCAFARGQRGERGVRGLWPGALLVPSNRSDGVGARKRASSSSLPDLFERSGAAA